ncbi:MAG: hypothetical protein Q9183_003538, partial [Haloplaca sp. 2 TL-2023]
MPRVILTRARTAFLSCISSPLNPPFARATRALTFPHCSQPGYSSFFPQSFGTMSRTAPIDRIADKLETPALDDRSYRVVRLPNQLEALLVHDPDTDKASASVNVNVGSFSDADDMPGMAHAVEHLLFMGTEKVLIPPSLLELSLTAQKYPVENDYNQYLSANSGYSNAYTSSTETNYFFEVAASSSQDSDTSTSTTITSPLHGALDRFAQFFIAPLFLSSTLDRELRA